MGSTRELKDLADETFGTNRNPIEPYLSPFIAVTTSRRRSANNFIPREKSCVDFPFDLSTGGRWRKLDTGSLKVCAIGSPFAPHVVVIHSDGSFFFFPRDPPRNKISQFQKICRNFGWKTCDDTITYTRVMMYYWQRQIFYREKKFWNGRFS